MHGKLEASLLQDVVLSGKLYTNSINKFFYFFIEFNSSLLESKVLGESSSSSQGNGNWTSYVVTVWVKGENFKSYVFCMAAIAGPILVTTLSKVHLIRLTLACQHAVPQYTGFPQYYAHIQHINDDSLQEDIPIAKATYVIESEIHHLVRTKPSYKKLAFLEVSH